MRADGPHECVDNAVKLLHMRWNPAKRIQNPSYDTKGATVGTWLFGSYRIQRVTGQDISLRIMHIILVYAEAFKGLGYFRDCMNLFKYIQFERKI